MNRQTMETLSICNGALPAEFAQNVKPGPHGAIPPGFTLAQLEMNEGRIHHIGPNRPASQWPTLDAVGCVILPGFIDVHVHGSVGYDVMDAVPAALVALARFFVQHGVPAFVPTT